MEETVYGDLLFFINFCMDFQCLFLTAKLLHRPFPLFRAMFSAAFGALYACAALFIYTTGGIAFLSDLLVCFLMCAGVFLGRGQGITRLPIPFALYFGVSFAVGGVMSGMASLLSRLDLPALEAGGSTSTAAFLFLALLGGVSTFVWGRLCQRRAKGARVGLTVIFEGKELKVQGLVDTANLLSDPISGRPVVILESHVLHTWLPALSCVLEQGTAQISSLPKHLAHRVRLVPADSVTGHTLLPALLPDAAFLDAGRGEQAVELLLAFAPLRVPKDCQALLPALLLTE